MLSVIQTVVWCLVRRLVFGPATETDVLALRHQVLTLQRQAMGPPRLSAWDRLLFAAVYNAHPRALLSILIVKPDTVVRGVLARD